MSYNWIPVSEDKLHCAYAYYRHSAEDRQENSIPIQSEQIHEFAAVNKIKIIKEFQDAGKSGLSTVGRDGFNKMIHEYVCTGKHPEVTLILVLDVSRWGRFQNIDESAYFTGLCRRNNVEVVYTSIGMIAEPDLMNDMRITFDRYQAASYSKNLSEKVFKGCKKIAEQGFRAGGSAPYGLKRVLLDEQRNYVQELKKGQRKSIQNQRVTLAPGNPDEVKVIKSIFRYFTIYHMNYHSIADRLNKECIPSPGGVSWSGDMIANILQNPLYTGTIVYNKTRSRLKSPIRKNPRSEWVLTPNSFESIIEIDEFEQAQEMIKAYKEEELRKFSAEQMAEKLRILVNRYDYFSNNIIKNAPDLNSPHSYKSKFGSLEHAYQYLHQDILDSCKQQVIEKLIAQGVKVEDYGEFIVIDDYSSVHIQPRMYRANCYEASWTFHPLNRKQVDLTLGILLSHEDKDWEILGYLLFPTRLTFKGKLYFSSSDIDKMETYSCSLEETVNRLRRVS